MVTIPRETDQRPVPEAVELRIVAPMVCSTGELSTFCGLVLQGEEVAQRGLENRAQQAQALVFLRVNDDLVGVAGLKVPVASYRDKVFRNAGVLSDAPRFKFELGWVFVTKAYRRKGYAKVLSAAALTQNDRQATFATMRADNMGIQSALKCLGFRRFGDSWTSTQHKQAEVVLFILT